MFWSQQSYPYDVPNYIKMNTSRYYLHNVLYLFAYLNSWYQMIYIDILLISDE